MMGEGASERCGRSAAAATAALVAVGCLAAVLAGAAGANVADSAKTTTVRLSAAPQAEAAKKKGKKKRKKVPAAISRVSTVPLAAEGIAAAEAGCTRFNHSTGGGYTVAPHFAPDGPSLITGTGLRTVGLSSNPIDTGWHGSAAALSNPAASGTLSTWVRCESNALGRIALRASSAATLQPGEIRTLNFVCPVGSHAISGGYSTDAPATLSSINSWRVTILQSRRTAANQWSITGFNRGQGAPANTASTLTGYAVCELDAKGAVVSEASAGVPLGENARASADPFCPAKTHSISSGFAITPIPAGDGAQIPVTFVDEDVPVGPRGWHLGLHEWSNALLPDDPKTLVGTVYCKADPKAKKKKRRKK